MNLAWWLERSTWEHPDNAAAIDGLDGRAVSYAELSTLAARLGNVLRDHFGVVQDEIVATLMTDDHRHQALYYGVLGVGAVFTGLNRAQLPAKHEADLRKSRSRTLVATSDQMEVARRLRETGAVANVVEYSELAKLAESAPSNLRIAPRSQRDLAAINFTAGTTGVSKGVMFAHGTLGASEVGAVMSGGITSRDRDLALIGMFHSGGISDGTKWVVAGATVIWSGGWQADRVATMIRDLRPSWIYFIVPTMVRDLIKNPAWPELELTGIRVHIAGEPVPPDIQKALADKGMRIANLYGLTETMPVQVMAPSLYYGEEAVVPMGSPGRPSKDFCEVRLIDPFTKQEVADPNVEGEICVRGDVVTPGYFEDPERTAAAIDSDGWLHTQDLAHRDEAGFYWIQGRIDDIINSGAEKVSLLEVDSVLLEHPKVADAATVGVAHDRFGEVPCAFVVPTEPMSEAEMRDILDAWCLEHLERWKRPRLYVMVTEVPRTAAKRTKQHSRMREQIEGVVVRDEDGVTTLGAIQMAIGRP
jgi:acyl-CoA synthetase (AMP-forming)/AMP-acid ligase II